MLPCRPSYFSCVQCYCCHNFKRISEYVATATCKDWKGLQNYTKWEGFEANADCGIHKLETRGALKEVPRPKGVRMLPLKWVFTSKFDDGGYLLRCKSRLCVRGDLQRLNEFLILGLLPLLPESFEP